MKTSRYKHILIIADIEGSSGCWSYEASRFLTREWAEACRMMSEDIAAVAPALFRNGVERVTIKDFHRTGYNLMREMIDPRARLVSGYLKGPVPGIGDPGDADAAMFIGFHAASGTEGFLAHTLTSRIARLEINGKLMTELELVSSSLAPFGVTPVFFSGCPVACSQALKVVKNITTHPIEKSKSREEFDAMRWRTSLVKKAVESLNNRSCRFDFPRGPFKAVVSMRDGEKIANKLSRRWGMRYSGKDIIFEADNIHSLYMDLIRICYLTPLIEKHLRPALFLYNLQGRLGLEYARLIK